MRSVLHVDLNNFFASVECLYAPELRSLPVAVSGNVEARHGIILAKNELAKKYGVKTGYTVNDAKKLCPDIVLVPPHYDRYVRFSNLARKIYSEYTDRTESFGIDECWLDITGCGYDGKKLADTIRERIYKEMGVTASVGVSYNKIFAKMGSDYKKPDATTVITRENFRSLIWPLPVSDMLFVGSGSAKKLRLYGIHTVGDLAGADRRFLTELLGKNGGMLYDAANGNDTSRICKTEEEAPIKSIGNSTTAPRDLVSDDDVSVTLGVLCESVAMRLRKAAMKCTVVGIDVRGTNLAVYTHQTTLASPTYLAENIYDNAMKLWRQCRIYGSPLRSIGVRGSSLVPEYGIQISAFCDAEKEQRREKLEKTLDCLKRRFGHGSVRNAMTLISPELSDFCPMTDHTIHPEPFIR